MYSFLGTYNGTQIQFKYDLNELIQADPDTTIIVDVVGDDFAYICKKSELIFLRIV